MLDFKANKYQSKYQSEFQTQPTKNLQTHISKFQQLKELFSEWHSISFYSKELNLSREETDQWQDCIWKEINNIIKPELTCPHCGRGYNWGTKHLCDYKDT